MKKSGPGIPTDPSGAWLSRRSFLIRGACLAAAAGMGISCNKAGPAGNKRVPGSIIGANRRAGHMLLQGADITPSETGETGIVIVGGGIAGLSAARDLAKKGISDFLMLELEDRIGGNSAYAVHKVSPYPLGAHYVPLPGEEAVFVRELFEELGIIEGYNSTGLPLYNEYYLCADPQERLFIHDRWQEGLVPQFGATAEDKRQYQAFFGMMDDLRKARGRDGRRAFVIPVELSSRDRRFLKYDEISMARFMSDNGLDSKYLRWYVNYCCRDDYGCVMEDVSAWAGIHYFAGRSGNAANAETHAVVTWPEGNGWIVRKMADNMSEHIRCNACVLDIRNIGNKTAVDYIDHRSGIAKRILARAVIYAAPRFTALRSIKDLRESPPAYAGSFGYAPWMVANVVVSSVPEGNGAPLSWDNVFYGNDSLGYVVANHQDVALHQSKTVLTYYYPLTAGDPAAERQRAVTMTFDAWADMIIRDLSRFHPGIEKGIEEVNVWLWGHAMVRPVPKFIWGRARQEALRPLGRIFFAHSDMSGISLFEEAQYRGILAARSARAVLEKAKPA
ncbi:MAG: FAD-dependent oxidoreductase [Thermodesulfovibrionales bacterium]